MTERNIQNNKNTSVNKNTWYNNKNNNHITKHTTTYNRVTLIFLLSEDNNIIYV
jgi:hypothetical protein